MKSSVITLGLLTILISACTPSPSFTLLPQEQFQTVVDNQPVSLYTLSNPDGLTMQVTNYGARVISLWTPDRNENWEDVVLGYENIDRYLNNKGERFLGASIGRYGNRIANGKFALNDTVYQLSTFNNGQCLHGGDKGFDRVVWNVDSVFSNRIYFSYISKNMEEGFPGNLKVKMTYSLNPENEFQISYEATTDKATPINLTHHSFFNLKGEGNGSINDHILHITADKYTPVNEVLIPMGTLEDVEDTPFDFRTPTAIGERLNQKNTQFENCKGYDHNFVLNRKTEDSLEFAASVYEPENGRYMEVWTTEPGLQFYGGNFFNGKTIGKSGKSYEYRGAFALETQHFPDSPNQPSFPSTILKPGEVYHHTCIYKFSSK